MQTPNPTTPLNYLQALQWPVVVIAAFALGHAMSKLENRVLKAEKNVQDLIERHMPSIHRALTDVRSKLDVLVDRLR
jgi:hypothetical protein